jgi:hypothetical protein
VRMLWHGIGLRIFLVAESCFLCPPLALGLGMQRFSCWPEVKANLRNHREYLRRTADPALAAGNMTLIDLIGSLYNGSFVEIPFQGGALLVTNAGACANHTAAALLADAAFNHDLNADMVRDPCDSSRCCCDFAFRIHSFLFHCCEWPRVAGAGAFRRSGRIDRCPDVRRGAGCRL